MAELVVRGYPWLLGLLLAAWAAALAVNAQALARELKPRGRPWPEAWAGALALAALVATAPQHQLGCDEFTHINIAQNLSRLGSFAVSLASDGRGLDILQAPPWPGGFHFILALAFKAAGASETLAFSVNALAAALGIAAVFFAASHLWDDKAAGVAAVLILALDGPRRLLAGTTDPAVMSQLWLALSLLAFSYDLKRRDPASLGLLLATSLFAAQVRPENLCLLPVFLGRRAARSKAGPWALAVFAAVLAGAAVWYAGILRQRPGESAELLRCLAASLPRNIVFLARPLSPYAPLCALAAWGAWSGWRQGRRAAVAVAAALFLVLLGVYSAYPLHDLGLLKRSPAHAVGLLLPLAVLAGAGASSKAKARIAGWGLLAAYAVLAARPGSTGTTFQHAEEFRRDEAFLRANAALVPENTYVAAYCQTQVLVAAKKPSFSLYLLGEGLPALEAAAEKAGFIVFADFWWAWRLEQSIAFTKLFLRPRYDERPIARSDTPWPPRGLWALTRKAPAKEVK